VFHKPTSSSFWTIFRMNYNRQWIFRKSSSQYKLVAHQIPIPEPASLGPNECLVRIRAASLNYRDIIAWKKLAGRNVDERVPLSDGAGEIVAVGPKVQQWSPADRVAACFFPTWLSGQFSMAYHQKDLGGNLDGMLRDYAIFHEDALVRIPNNWSFPQAATLPCAAVTAWSALFRRGQLQPGQTVLALGTGGVSIYALQLAKALGAQVAITSSSQEKLDKASALGADLCINYKETPQWSKPIWEWTQKRGVDHVVEVGGPGTLEQSLLSVAPEGKIAMIGVLTGFGPPQCSLFPLLARNASLHGIYVGSRTDFQNLIQFIQQHPIEPQIDAVFSFDQAPQAFERIASAQHFGKIVIEM
jgi:NADPH:quinone reductase-like Zn-dependent oxidoreductase